MDRMQSAMPRRGVLATEAGRRVALGVGALAGMAGAVVIVVLGVVIAVLRMTGALGDSGLMDVMLGMFAGLGALGLAFLMLPLMSRISGIADDFRLLELSNPGAPLLRELMTEAPGSYSHSIMAGSLAETAANEIGANGLLARVGAYYHDIGKCVRPHFFVENQAGLANPHDIASPEQSAFVITAHVREGVVLARRGRLPEPVIDIIRQHHGTSVVACFYEKARQGEGPVVESDFRYDAQMPQSREAALVMLADAAEAAARVLCDPTEERLRVMVGRIAAAKSDDGQLRESHMSETDIEHTVDAYAKMLASVYHARVGYPTDA